ncbi:MAG: hypothetical protein MUE51_15115, partial [Thermoleophilia bacterium]|nr:hypothetical protein [Thermoleophilia bacterium]
MEVQMHDYARRSRRLAALAGVAGAAAALASSAVAAPALDGTFPVTGVPGQMATGPDGNVWFTLSASSAGKEFGRITPLGAVTEFDTVDGGFPSGITTGPDGQIWMTTTGKVYRVNPVSGANTPFPVLDVNGQTITTGPDGNLWTGGDGKVLKISTAGALLDGFPVAGLSARGITA